MQAGRGGQCSLSGWFGAGSEGGAPQKSTVLVQVRTGLCADRTGFTLSAAPEPSLARAEKAELGYFLKTQRP